MKKIIITGLILIGFTALQAQTNAIDKYFNDYQEQDSFTKVKMSSKAFELMTKFDCDDNELEEMKEMASQIDQLNVIVDSERITAKSDYKKGLGYLEDDYEELMSFSDKRGAFKFFIDESAGIVKELVIFGANDSTLAIVSLTGRMDLKKVGQISSKISQTSMNMMKKSHNVDKVIIYPNPVNKGEDFTLKLPSELSDVQIEVINTNGKVVISKHNCNAGERINTASLSSGNYVVRVIGDGITINKKFIVE